MADIWTKAKRSAVMSLIRGHGNKDTELRLIKIFRLFGIIGWRRKQKLFGKPDFVFRKQRVVVFVDGCFWHGCRNVIAARVQTKSIGTENLSATASGTSR
jgi:DNA mismatch endonuclease (patch repair protein)